MPKTQEELNLALNLACMGDDVKEVKQLLAQGADILHTRGQAFGRAIDKKQMNVLKSLVEELGKKQEPDKNEGLERAFVKAIIYENEEAAEYLLSCNKDLLNNPKVGAVSEALSTIHDKMLKFLINKGADLNLRDEEGNNVLEMHFLTFVCPNPKILRALCEGKNKDGKNGLRVNEQNPRGEYPIHLAMQTILNYDDFDKQQENPQSFKNDMKEVLNVMFEYGADVHAKDNEGKTARDILASAICETQTSLAKQADPAAQIKLEMFKEFEALLCAKENVKEISAIKQILKADIATTHAEKITNGASRQTSPGRS